MKEKSARLLGAGNATQQADSFLGNVAAGAQNPGWGSLAQDLAAGNFGSAVGNVTQMGGGIPPQQPVTAPPQQYQASALPRQPPAPLLFKQPPYMAAMMGRYLA